ncbi:hypothetical protein [Paraburkholderia fungorum]|uniref:Uncharacterized protein n=1 Tax=Paraburkholderia fungorum TaxID=134537 RepID=A0AAW3V060_9BURK|nr:hypothetical protein [Paraburkholderia fungorum]MBB4517249.1 hypothetical protein [Paraburkholderia fungorum]MBB6204317.1 hypothetical protein [Paraburkholderia fungorum]
MGSYQGGLSAGFEQKFPLRINLALTMPTIPPTLAPMVPSPHAAHAGSALRADVCFTSHLVDFLDSTA